MLLLGYVYEMDLGHPKACGGALDIEVSAPGVHEIHDAQFIVGAQSDRAP
jgi:hypothetical protein